VVSDGGMRASDSDREKVVEILGAAYTEGRLALDEFDDRTTAAYAAKTWGELRQLTSDLPAGASLDSQRAAAAPDGIPPSLPPAGPPSRGILIVPFVPVALVLLILAMSAHAALLFVPLLIVLFVLRASRRGHGRGPRGNFPPGPGGRVPPRTGGDPL
jgi:Domain of unknown function (DUF1707)